MCIFILLKLFSCCSFIKSSTISDITSVGIRLSSLINKQFFDLDEFIEEKYNQKIHNIFSTKGEIYFRKMERNAKNFNE